MKIQKRITTKRLAVLVLAGGGLLAAAIAGGCASYANVPGPTGQWSVRNPNARNPMGVVTEALRWTINKYPVDGPYAVELPTGMTGESAQRVLDALPPGGHRYGARATAMPTYHIGRVWIRSGLSKVDVLRPVEPVMINGKRATHQGVTVWMEGGLEPWHVVRTQRWAVGAIPKPDEHFIPTGLSGTGRGADDPYYESTSGRDGRVIYEPTPEALDAAGYDNGMQPFGDAVDTAPEPAAPADYQPSPHTPEPMGEVRIEPLSGGSSGGSSWTPPAAPAAHDNFTQPAAAVAPASVSDGTSDTGGWVRITPLDGTPAQPAPFPTGGSYAPPPPAQMQPVPASSDTGSVLIEPMSAGQPMQGTGATWADSAEMPEPASYEPIAPEGDPVPTAWDPFAVQGDPSDTPPPEPKPDEQPAIIIEPTK